MTSDYTLLRATLRPGKYGYIGDFLTTVAALGIVCRFDVKTVSLYKSVSRRRILLRFLSTVSLCKIDEHLTW